MPVLGFQARFVPLVETGQKRQTIRGTRADGLPHVKVGKSVDLVAGNRTPQRRVINRGNVTAYDQIYLRFGPGRHIQLGDPSNPTREAGHLKLDQFARADGFKDWAELEEWFAKVHECEHGFGGWLIQWTPETVTLPVTSLSVGRFSVTAMDMGRADGDHTVKVEGTIRDGKMHVTKHEVTHTPKRARGKRK